ncbi:MAG: uroporphyrinogen-III synthase [Woeseiaceae bacterium]|nr:uroporphyrinogen-III synthase [Woeseiaceae bacterium]
MANGPLTGMGVLVTRPRTQAAALADAIERAGGRAFCLPAIEIVPLEPQVIREVADEQPTPDVVVFISRNAVEHGIRYTDGARIAVIGPATAAAVEAAGRVVDIQPASGYDSEHLLAETPLHEVDGKHVRIIRGSQGRELLAEELRARGATVEYLSVYERRVPDVDPDTLAELERCWRQGDLNVITVMSVESLANLSTILPEWCAAQVASTPLVTPSGRVLKEALDRYPASRPVLAAGPGAEDMVQAIIALQHSDAGTAP